MEQPNNEAEAQAFISSMTMPERVAGFQRELKILVKKWMLPVATKNALRSIGAIGPDE